MFSVVPLVGLFGVAMATLGSLVAMFAGLVGLVVGGEGAGIQVGQSLIGISLAGVALVGAIKAVRHPRLGVLLLAGSGILGVVVVGAYYAVGTILLLIASLIAITGRHSRLG